MITTSFDPGLMTGWSVFEDDKLIDKGQAQFLDMLDVLDKLPRPDVVVYENFQLLPHKAKAQIGSKFETVQAIGMVKAYAHRYKAKIVEQRPGVMDIAEKWTGVKRMKNHAEGHWVCAFLHGSYYLIKEGYAKSLLELQEGKP